MGRVTCEDGLRFSMAKLHRWHNLATLQQSGNCTSTWSRNGEKFAQINYQLNVFDETPYMRLWYHWNEQPYDYRIYLTKTKLHFGGHRWWFICPQTRKRCAVLYKPPGQPYFASRKAYGLAYESQREDHWYRLLRRSRKIEDRYGVPRWADGWFPKPKGMHLRTYTKRLAELDWYQQRLDMRLFDIALRFDPELRKQLGV